MKSYQELLAWQKAMDLAEQIYKLVKLLPKEENYALADQLRRAAISVPSNIAEGQARNSPKEFIQFLSIARGSAAEIETQLLLCERLGFVARAQIDSLIDLCVEIAKMLSSLISTLIKKA